MDPAICLVILKTLSNFAWIQFPKLLVNARLQNTNLSVKPK